MALSTTLSLLWLAGSEDLMHGSIKMAAELGTIQSISFSEMFYEFPQVSKKLWADH